MSLLPRPSLSSGLTGRALFEAALIVFAVVIGFLVTEWRETRRAEQTARTALSRIADEMEANVAALEAVVGYHETVASNLQAQVAAIDAGEAASDGVLFERLMPALPQGIREPRVSTIAWDFATLHGGLDLLDYNLIAEIAQIYSVQTEGPEASWKGIVESTFRDADTHRTGDVRAELIFLGFAFRELAVQERYLIGLYRTALPKIRVET